MDLREELRAAREKTNAWMRQRAEQLARTAAEAQTPAGRARLAANARQQGRAAISGAVDEASFGGADYLSAAIQTAAKTASGQRTDFRRELKQERQKDAIDARDYGFARNTGRVAGFAGSLAVTGGAGAGLRAGARLLGEVGQVERAAALAYRLEKAGKAANAVKRIAPLDPRGLTAVAATGGAASGVVGQVGNDVASGRVGSLGDYVGAAGGGALGGVLLSRGPLNLGRFTSAARRIAPMVVGGVEGAATTVAQAALDGRDVDLVDVAQAARLGAVGARVGDVVGKYGVNSLSNATKGKLGDTLSIGKSIISGDGSPWRPPIADFDSVLPGVTPRGKTPGGPGEQRWIKLPGNRWTRADHITDRGIAVEAKMGAYADLSDAQRIAKAKLPVDRYRIDHWLPSDIGRGGAVSLGAFTSPWPSAEPR